MTTETKRANFTAPGTRQPDLDRRFDKTQLKSQSYQHLVHRDYAAHYFRWGFIKNWVKTNDKAKVLDIGCGQDLPLPSLLSHTPSFLPKTYVGVDLNKIAKKFNAKWVGGIHDEFNFIDNWKEILDQHGKFDVIVNLEVIEHMHVKDGLKLLKAMKSCLNPEGSIFLSTPCYDGKRAAANHLHEYTVPELAESIDKAGLKVSDRWGTFMNWNALKKVATSSQLELVNQLRAYYHLDVLSIFLAPLYPDDSRNNMWRLTHPESSQGLFD